MKFFFYFVRKNRASQYVSVRVYFVAFKKFFFLSRKSVCVIEFVFVIVICASCLVLNLISVAPYPDYTV